MKAAKKNMASAELLSKPSEKAPMPASSPSTTLGAKPRKDSSTAPVLLPTKSVTVPSPTSSGAIESTLDHSVPEIQLTSVQGTEVAPGQDALDTRLPRAGGLKLVVDQCAPDTQVAGVDDTESDSGQNTLEPHLRDAGVPPTGGGTTTFPYPSSPAFLSLRVWAEMYYDAQKARIACENRAERGGVDPNVYAFQLEAMASAEHVMKLALGREYRYICPPGIKTWAAATRGIGAGGDPHLLARLLGHIGHPRHTVPHHWEGAGENRVLIEEGPMERRVSDLWSYCGHGDPERRKRKGQSPEEGAAAGSPIAKMLVHLMAESCMKAGGPYRAIYDRRREVTAITHPDWTKGHSHNDALRIVGKAILEDLWVAAGEEEL